MNLERDELVTEVPDRRRQDTGQGVTAQIKIGERGSVAKLERDGPGQGVDVEEQASEHGELAELSGEGAGEVG